MKTKILSLAVPILVLFAMAGCGHKSDVTPSDSTNSASDSTNAAGNQAAQSIMTPSDTNSSVTNLNSTNSSVTTNNP
jgi:predicted small lipoprotein YifL